MATLIEPRVQLPQHGMPRDQIRAQMGEAASHDALWRERLAAGTNYMAGDDVVEVAKEAYLSFFSTNGLLPSTFPSLARFEREVIDYTAGLLHGPGGGREHHVRRLGEHPDGRQVRAGPGPRRPPGDHAAHGWSSPNRPIRRSGRPPTTSGWSWYRVPLRPDLQIDLDAYRRRDRRRHGPARRVRPEPDARDGRPDRGARPRWRAERDINFHVDSCVGGYFLPFAEKLGYPVPDLRLPRPGRDHDLRRPAQVRLHGQGRVGRSCRATRRSSATRSSSSAARSGRTIGT